MADQDQNLNEESFDMKRYFKKPEDIQDKSFKEYTKIVKRAFKSDLNAATFMFVTKFKFKEGEDKDKNPIYDEQPMMFFGPLNSLWKKAIKTDYKTRKDFAMGICAIEEVEGVKVLKLNVHKGKGKKELNRKMLKKAFKKY